MPLPSYALGKAFAQLPDPRVQGRCRHQLLDIITIAICAVICGANDWHQIVAFGQCRLDWLQQFLALPNGIPSHDTFERVFARLDPQRFGRCFFQWTQSLAAALGIEHIAIDGKTLCGSQPRQGDLGPLHLVSAWASDNHLSLGQVAVDEKSNEITAIPKLLQLLDLSGALVTIDAMGCQKQIARQIVEGGGDYVLIVKGNQESLLDDVQNCLGRAMEDNYQGYDIDDFESTEKGHGRQEYRSVLLLRHPQGLGEQEQWAGLKAIGMYTCERTEKGKAPTTEVRYFIGSSTAGAEVYAKALRQHWGIENNLHWQMDVSFGEDASRISGRHAAENFALLRRMALVLLKRHPQKGSIACKRLRAALDTDFLEEVLFGSLV